MSTHALLYAHHNMRPPAYQLRYTWTGWPSRGQFPPGLNIERVCERWETDGIRLLERKWRPDQMQFTFSAKPDVSPKQLAARVKGRLEHFLRQAGFTVAFSRKVAVGSIGANHVRDVENYIEGQLDKEMLVDDSFRKRLSEFTVVRGDVDLSKPTLTKRGRYWYNLHLVLLVKDRARLNDVSELRVVREGCLRLAEDQGYSISRLSIIPDHLHTSLRGKIDHSPEDIALKFLNSLAEEMGNQLIWEPCYYAGTIGTYDMNAVRRP